MPITPHLAPCLVVLRAQFNHLAPDRDKASDGWIADGNHSSTSDHQPDGRGVVHALDVDSSGPWPDGLTMAGMVARVVRAHREGKDDRLTYVIHDRKIWSASRDWAPRPYSGPNPHDRHAHFSCAGSVSAENDTSTFTLREVPIMATAEEIAAAVWAHPLSNGSSAGGNVVTIGARTGYLANQFAHAISKAVAEIAAEDVDEQELATRLAALLPNDEDVTPEALQAAIIGAFRELTAPSA